MNDQLAIRFFNMNLASQKCFLRRLDLSGAREFIFSISSDQSFSCDCSKTLLFAIRCLDIDSRQIKSEISDYLRAHCNNMIRSEVASYWS